MHELPEDIRSILLAGGVSDDNVAEYERLVAQCRKLEKMIETFK